jgi:hypothetical protein
MQVSQKFTIQKKTVNQPGFFISDIIMNESSLCLMKLLKLCVVHVCIILQQFIFQFNPRRDSCVRLEEKPVVEISTSSGIIWPIVVVEQVSHSVMVRPFAHFLL